MVKLHLLIHRIFQLLYSFYRLFFRATNLVRSIWVGFFLGALSERQLEKVDRWFYDLESDYVKDTYNRKPLFLWEKAAIREYFASCRNIFVFAVGGGREMYNLSKMGFEVDGSEYNTKLREYAQKFLTQENIPAKVYEVKRDSFPELSRSYDGVILGWGVYTHLRGRQNRIRLIKEIAEVLQPGSMLLVSFWALRKNYLHLNKICKVGNFTAKIFNNPLAEYGDSLDPEYVHYFSEIDIEEELKEAGFEMIFYNHEDYGHAVARKRG